MILNYLKIVLRQLLKYKVYSLINITGLALGLAISIVLGLYVIDDFTYDQFHEGKEQIYRVLTNDNSGGTGSAIYSITAGPLLVTSKNEIPEVIASTRFANGFRRVTVPGKDPEKDGINAGMLVTDPGFFDVFSFKIIKGNAADLTKRNAVFVTPEIANALYGDEEALGKPIITEYVEESYIAGIVEAPPKNSHIQFDILVSLMIDRNPFWWDHWDNVLLSGYIKIQEGINPKKVEKKMVTIASVNGMDGVFTPAIQPLLDVHLGSSDYLYDFGQPLSFLFFLSSQLRSK
jgi:putative ABC transport system permease protein